MNSLAEIMAKIHLRTIVGLVFTVLTIVLNLLFLLTIDSVKRISLGQLFLELVYDAVLGNSNPRGTVLYEIIHFSVFALLVLGLLAAFRLMKSHERGWLGWSVIGGCFLLSIPVIDLTALFVK